MAFLPKPGEKIENAESASNLYELSGSADDRLRQEYKVWNEYFNILWQNKIFYYCHFGDFRVRIVP